RDSPTSSPLPLSSSLTRPPPTSTLFPYTTLFRSLGEDVACPSMVPLDPPTITPAAGTFSQPTPVTLDHELADAALYYTISEVGQVVEPEPGDIRSRLYTQPFTISAPLTGPTRPFVVRARVFRDGHLPSAPD